MNTKSKSNNLKKLLALTLFGVNVNALGIDSLKQENKELHSKEDNLKDEIKFTTKELEEFKKVYEENVKKLTDDEKKKLEKTLKDAEDALAEFKKNNPDDVANKSQSFVNLEKQEKDAKDAKTKFEDAQKENVIAGNNLTKVEAIIKENGGNSLINWVISPYKRFFSDNYNFSYEKDGENNTIGKERDNHNARWMTALAVEVSLIALIVYGIYRYTSSEQEGSEVAAGTGETAA